MLVVALLQADRLDGFESATIRALTAGGLTLLAAFLVNEWFHPLPFFRLQLLARRNFTHGLLTLAGAVMLLTAVAAIPGHHLAGVHGYRPLQTAPLSLLVAVPLLLSLPLTAALLNLRWVDSRWVLATGCLLMALTCVAGSRITAEWIRDDFYWLQSLQIVAQPMLILPILMGVTTGLPPAEGPFASAMFNSLKTFSAALATGLLETWGTAREHLHSNQLVDQLGNRAQLSAGAVLDNATGLAPLAHRLHEQALVLASADLYRLAACVAFALLLLVPLLPVRIAPPPATSFLALRDDRHVIRHLPKHKALAAAALVIAVGVAACAGTHRLIDSHTETTDDAYIAADFTLVAPRVAGPLVEVLVDDNQHVRAGQLLLRIDDRDFRAALTSAQADVEAARAAVANDEAEIARQPALIDGARRTARRRCGPCNSRRPTTRATAPADNGAGTAQEQQRAASTLAGQLAKRAGDAAALASISQNLACAPGATRQTAHWPAPRPRSTRRS